MVIKSITYNCTAGWETRCRLAKWAGDCHCACGGTNHQADIAQLPYEVPKMKELWAGKGKILGLIAEKGAVVYLNMIWLNPEESLRVVNYSPTGFSWGYSGSGPSQLALAIGLRLAPSKEIALAKYQEFKNKFLATGDKEVLSLNLEEARKFWNDV